MVENMTPDGIFITLHFIQNLRSVGHIHKLRRSRDVENMTPGGIFIRLHFLQKICIGPISSCVTLHYSGKAYQGQILQIIRPIHKLQRN